MAIKLAGKLAKVRSLHGTGCINFRFPGLDFTTTDVVEVDEAVARAAVAMNPDDYALVDASSDAKDGSTTEAAAPRAARREG